MSLHSPGSLPARAPSEDIPLRPVSRSRIRAAPFGQREDSNGFGSQHDARMDRSAASKASVGKRRKSRLSDAVDPEGSEPDGEQEWLIGGRGAEDGPGMQLGGAAPQQKSRLRKGRQKAEAQPRTVKLPPTKASSSSFAPNVLRNQKYSVVSFFPVVFYEQFKFFFNLYFLLVALSQFIPALKIGFIVTYVAPLAFVLCVTMGKEAYDDYQRHLRDKEANGTRYLVFDHAARIATAAALSRVSSPPEHGPSSPLTRSIPSSKIRVGDMVILEKNMRVPADMILLRTSEGPTSSATMAEPELISPIDASPRLASMHLPDQQNTAGAAPDDDAGTCFIRTDQLDGETDWKLRIAVARTQKMSDPELLNVRGELYADPPIKDIHAFVGNLTLSYVGTDDIDPSGSTPETIPLGVDNLLWSNTVLAAGTAVGLVVYTGKDTRAVMNTSEPETKVGLLDLEINKMAKILCAVTFALSVLLVALNGFRGHWGVYVFRFLILFSSIIPISLRVNLDMAKTVYAHQIEHDKDIPGAVVRTSTLPEECGRLEYLLSDKTGTLTQNEMEMKKLHMGTIAYGWDSMDEVAHQLVTAFGDDKAQANGSANRRQPSLSTGMMLATRGRKDISSRLREAVIALGVCHNVTPVFNDDGSITYQASSPDEVAIVKWTDSVGVTLVSRERTRMSVRDPAGSIHSYKILAVFPFTSESKRMGIIVQDERTGEVSFYQKGADVVMAKIVTSNDWLDEECDNLAREGLRTLVIGRKRLSSDAYAAFDHAYQQAQVAVSNRAAAVSAVIAKHLEHDLELLALTGVEDKLQEDVKTTLELLRNAGLKIWMLTGDKLETARVISLSSKLVARGQYIHAVSKLQTTEQALHELDFLRTRLDCALLIDGESLQLCLDNVKSQFIASATQLPVVIACRCSPTQKADVARLIRASTKKRVCCVGDGGNDVSMIQAADVGIGIVGKEGKQASLAADFSINQFSHLTKLLLWHGRNSYKRSAKLAQFVIHRGLIVSVIQAVFSSIFFFAPIALYQGWLQVGYATLYTMAPVFSLVLDKDVSEDLALLYPELYKELTKGRSLSSKTFFTWLLISLYQGGAIMVLSLYLFESEFINIVAISFSALVINELIMVALEITTWHSYMVISELATFLIYAGSMAVLPEYFDLHFVLSYPFLSKTAFIVLVSSAPLYILRLLQRRFAPAAYAKVAQY